MVLEIAKSKKTGLKFWSKIEILLKNGKFGQKNQILVKNGNIGQKIHILVKN